MLVMAHYVRLGHVLGVTSGGDGMLRFMYLLFDRWQAEGTSWAMYLAHKIEASLLMGAQRKDKA